MSRRRGKKAANGMGSIIWREAREVYEAAVTVGVTPAGNPRRVYGSFPTLREAELWRAQQLLDLEAGSLILPDTATLAELVDRWEANHPQWAPSTIADRVGTLRRHVLPYLGDKRVMDLKPADVAGLLGVLRRARPNPREGAKPETLTAASEGTIHRVVRHLRACLDYAVSIELARRNVTAGIRTSPPPPERRVRWSIEETRAVLEVAAEYGQAHAIGNYVYVALMTGMRREELRGLRWQDVNTDRAEVSVRQVVTEVDGHMHYGPPKTSASRRVIPVDVGTLHALEQQEAVQALQRKAAAEQWEGRDLVFTNRTGGPLRPKQLRYHLRVIAKQAGVREIRLYDTRSTHGSILAETGVNPKAISERLGHTDVGFTMRTYVRTGEGEQRAIAEAMGSLGPAPQRPATESASPVPERGESEAVSGEDKPEQSSGAGLLSRGN